MAIGTLAGFSERAGRLRPVPASVHVQLALGLRSLALVDTDAEMRRRLAYALNAAMGAKGWKSPDLAKAIGRDASTVTRWANGESVPNMLMTKSLAGALGVRPEFLFDPPEVPDYPLADFLLEAADSGAAEAHRRETTGPAREARDTPPGSHARPPRVAGAARR